MLNGFNGGLLVIHSATSILGALFFSPVGRDLIGAGTKAFAPSLLGILVACHPPLSPVLLSIFWSAQEQACFVFQIHSRSSGIRALAGDPFPLQWGEMDGSLFQERIAKEWLIPN